MHTLLSIANLLALITLLATTVLGQSSGDYRSHLTGNWSDVHTWDRYDGATWVYPAVTVPTGIEAITIQSVDSVTVDSPVSLTGILHNAGKVGGWANLTVAGGGTYVHERNAGAIPICAWATGSTCLVVGVTDTAPGNTNQNFYDLIWNCAGQSKNLNLGWEDGPIVLRGSLKILNTNWSRSSITSPTPQLRFFGGSGSCTVEGDVIVDGNNAALTAMGSSYNDTISIKGSITISSNAVLSLSSNSAGIGLWYLEGDLACPDNGYLVKSSGANLSKLVFAKAGSQSYTGPASGVCDFSGSPNFEVISGSTLVLSEHKDYLYGSGNFSLDAGATLVTGDSSGINGVVRCRGNNPGGNVFSPAANYTFRGSKAQIPGSRMPTTVNNLTIDNPGGLTLGSTDTVNGALTLANGKITLGTKSLTVAALGGGSSSSYIVTDGTGSLTINNVGAGTVLFPVGLASSYNPVVISNAGTVDAFSVRVKSTFDFPPSSTAVVNRQWVINERATGANAAITLQWNTSDEDPGFVRTDPIAIGRYNGAQWAEVAATYTDNGDGTYSASAGGITAFSQFGVGNNGALPVQIAGFTATCEGTLAVRLDWTTVTELNNYGFVVERSREPRTGFCAVSDLIPGQGTTLIRHTYSFSDPRPGQGLWYYRLRQIDLNNAVRYTEPIKTEVVSSVSESAPTAFALFQNYPNPFNPITTIRYALPQHSRVALTVFDVLGREVVGLLDQEMGPGYHEVRFDGAPFASGVYYYRMQASDPSAGPATGSGQTFVQTGTFVLSK